MNENQSLEKRIFSYYLKTNLDGENEDKKVSVCLFVLVQETMREERSFFVDPKLNYLLLSDLQFNPFHSWLFHKIIKNDFPQLLTHICDAQNTILFLLQELMETMAERQVYIWWAGRIGIGNDNATLVNAGYEIFMVRMKMEIGNCLHHSLF